MITARPPGLRVRTISRVYWVMSSGSMWVKTEVKNVRSKLLSG